MSIMPGATAYRSGDGRIWSAVAEGYRSGDEVMSLRCLALEHGPLETVVDEPSAGAVETMRSIRVRFTYRRDDGFVIVAAMSPNPMLVTRCEIEVSWGSAGGTMTRAYLRGHRVLADGVMVRSTYEHEDYCPIVALPEHERAEMIEHVNTMLDALGGPRLDATSGEVAP